MDCGGFGGNWYWNHHIIPPQNIKIGLFSLGYASREPVTTPNIYTYSSNAVTTGAKLLASSANGCGGVGNAQLAVINSSSLSYKLILATLPTFS